MAIDIASGAAFLTQLVASTKDAPTPINVDRYRVWERLPVHWSYLDIVNAASTEDNANMRGFLDAHVFLVKDTGLEGIGWQSSPYAFARFYDALERE